MKILFLGYNESKTKLIRILKENNVVHHTEDKLLHNIEKYDLVISFGYRHIISIDNLKNVKDHRLIYIFPICLTIEECIQIFGHGTKILYTVYLFIILMKMSIQEI